MRIAWLGTGLMGSPMALRLVAAGHELAVWNRTAAHADATVAAGARRAGDPAAAVAGSEVVFTMLRDGPVTADLLFGDPAPELGGRIVVQMATIAPRESRDLAARVAAAGGRYLEAPVLGSIPQATSGELLVFTGGDAALAAELRPLLAPLAADLRHAGAVGAAATLKLAFNQLIVSLAAGFSLSLGLVRRGGVEVDLFMEILRRSALHSRSFDARLGRYLARDYSEPNFPLELLLKDTELALAEARAQGLADEGVRALREIVARGVAEGLGGLDYGALYEVVDPPR